MLRLLRNQASVNFTIGVILICHDSSFNVALVLSSDMEGLIASLNKDKWQEGVVSDKTGKMFATFSRYSLC